MEADQAPQFVKIPRMSLRAVRSDTRSAVPICRRTSSSPRVPLGRTVWRKSPRNASGAVNTNPDTLNWFPPLLVTAWKIPPVAWPNSAAISSVTASFSAAERWIPLCKSVPRLMRRGRASIVSTCGQNRVVFAKVAISRANAGLGSLAHGRKIRRTRDGAREPLLPMIERRGGDGVRA